MNTLRKRSVNKAYEIMGIRTAMEVSALLWEEYVNLDRVKEMTDLLGKVSVREYLTIRDKAYKDYRTAEETILARAKREGEEWKGVSEDRPPNSRTS
jgi:hypothetical protein